MVIKAIPADVALSELPEDATVWVVAGSETEVVLVPNPPDRQGVLMLFLKKADAEHLALLMRQVAPAFKDKELKVFEVRFRDIIERAIDENQPVALISPNEALEYFKTFDEWLADYYK